MVVWEAGFEQVKGRQHIFFLRHDSPELFCFHCLHGDAVKAECLIKDWVQVLINSSSLELVLQQTKDQVKYLHGCNLNIH